MKNDFKTSLELFLKHIFMSVVNQLFINDSEDITSEIRQLNLFSDNSEKLSEKFSDIVSMLLKINDPSELSEKLREIVSMLSRIDFTRYSNGFVLGDCLKMIPTINIKDFSKVFIYHSSLKTLE